MASAATYTVEVVDAEGGGHVRAQLPEHADPAGARHADERRLAGMQVREVRGRVAERREARRAGRTAASAASTTPLSV